MKSAMCVVNMKDVTLDQEGKKRREGKKEDGNDRSRERREGGREGRRMDVKE